MELLKDFFIEILKIFLLSLSIVLIIRTFLFQPFLIQGNSMEPSFKTGDYLVVEEVSKRFKDFQRGEAVVFQSPLKKRMIKRIVGLPGEEVEVKDGKIKINGEILDEKNYLGNNPFTEGELRMRLNKEEYFVLGDNRNNSLDSRIFGPVKKREIVGKILFQFRFPPIFMIFAQFLHSDKK